MVARGTEREIANALVRQVKRAFGLDPLVVAAGEADHLWVFAPSREVDADVVSWDARSGEGDMLSVAVSVRPEHPPIRLGVDPVVRRACLDQEILLIDEFDIVENPALGRLIGATKRLIVLPLFSEPSLFGTLVVRVPGSGPVSAVTLYDLWELASYVGSLLLDARLAQQKQSLARVDPMTGVLVRRAFESALRRETRRAVERGGRVSLVMFHVLGLRDINEDFGHLVGDQLLRRAAACLAAHARDFDVVARYGGNEFVMLLPSAGRDYALSVARSVQEQTARLREGVHATVSTAVATLPDDAPGGASLERAVKQALKLTEEWHRGPRGDG
ncbi:MAG: GGDEF domain-containing protein [Actinomycetota bacterium]|nr:GGDEF domain-containing protein [Actinomycetota bacterium]